MAFKTKAEKSAFKAGMAAQYNKEHPKYGYAVGTKTTYYNADGTMHGTPSYGLASFFKTESQAKKAALKFNEMDKFGNDKVLKAVHSGKVNIYSSADCSTSFSEYKKIKPIRVGKNEKILYSSLPKSEKTSKTSRKIFSNKKK